MRSLIIITLSLSATLVLGACASSDPSADSVSAVNGPVLCPPDAGSATRDAAVHDALMAHPEWLMEMSQALRQKQQTAQQEQAKKALADNRDAVYHNSADPVVGNPGGDVTVVEFFDVECPYCKIVAPEIARLYAADKGVRVVFKEYPILGPASVIAAKAALASIKQGRYEVFHNALMADKTQEHQLTEAHIFDLARSVHLNLTRLKHDMASPELDAQIAANKALAATIGVRGTPGLIIGDKLTPGAMPYPAMLRAVAEMRGQKTE